MPKAAGLHFFLHEGGIPTRAPVVLIHGAGSDHLIWPPEIRRISGVRVIAVDLPGHGRSAGLGRQTIDDYAGDMLDFLDGTGLTRAVIIGHGMGGAIALALVLDHPERVAGIGLISSGARHPIPSSIMENSANPATYHLAVLALGEMMSISPGLPNVKERLLDRYSSIRQPLMLGDLRACDRFNVCSRIEAIKTPALIVCGTEDKLTPRNYSIELAAGIPNAALQTVEAAGHLVMLEQPHRVAGLLSVFVQTIPYQVGS